MRRLALLTLIICAGMCCLAQAEFDVHGSNVPKAGTLPEQGLLPAANTPDFNAIDYDPRKIPKRFGKEADATRDVAFSFLLLFAVSSGFRFVMKASAGEEAGGLPSLWSLIVVLASLLGYKQIFTGIFQIGWLLENVFLDAGSFERFIDEMKGISWSTSGLLFRLSVPMLISALFSFLVWVVYCVMILARYVFGAILYVAGPLLIVAAMYKPCEKLANGWLLGIIQLALWVPLIRLVAAVFHEETIVKHINAGFFEPTATAGALIVATLCLVIIILAPIIVGKVVRGDALGGLALAATFTAALVSKYAISPVMGKLQNKFPQASLPGLPGQAGMAPSSRWAMFASQSVSSLQRGLQGLTSRFSPAKMRNAVNPSAIAQRGRVRESIKANRQAMRAGG